MIRKKVSNYGPIRGTISDSNSIKNENRRKNKESKLLTSKHFLRILIMVHMGNNTNELIIKSLNKYIGKTVFENTNIPILKSKGLLLEKPISQGKGSPPIIELKISYDLLLEEILNFLFTEIKVLKKENKLKARENYDIDNLLSIQREEKLSKNLPSREDEYFNILNKLERIYGPNLSFIKPNIGSKNGFAFLKELLIEYLDSFCSYLNFEINNKNIGNYKDFFEKEFRNLKKINLLSDEINKKNFTHILDRDEFTIEKLSELFFEFLISNEGYNLIFYKMDRFIKNEEFDKNKITKLKEHYSFESSIELELQTYVKKLLEQVDLLFINDINKRIKNYMEFRYSQD